MDASKATEQPKKFRFTKEEIAKLPPAAAGKRDTYYDTKESRLMLRVTDKGAKAFYVYRWHNGKPAKLKLGAFPDLSMEQARTEAAKTSSDLATGNDPREKKRAQKEAEQKELTLQQLFDAYIERHAKKQKKTWAEMINAFDRNVRNFGGLADRKAISITHDDANKLHGALGNDKNKGVYTANRTIQMLRAVYNKAKAFKIYDGDNPFESVSLFDEEARERFLSKDEMKKLFEALEKEPHQWTKDFVKLSLFTGQRKANVAAMRWDDIDLEAGTWVIKGTEMKNSKSMVVPLTAVVLDILVTRKALLEAEGKLGVWVFPSDSASGHITDIKRSWSTLRKRAGVEDCTIHDLRRSLGSWMASSNINMALIKGALNHKDMKTTEKHYARTAKSAQREAFEIAQASMLQAAGLIES